MNHTDGDTIRVHAANKHPNIHRFECFPALEAIEEQEAEGAAKWEAAEKERLEQAAVEAAAAKERKAAEAAAKPKATAGGRKGDLNGIAGWVSLARGGAEGYAKETVAVAGDNEEQDDEDEDADEPPVCRYRAATAEALKAAFIKACAEVEDLEEGVADEDLLEAVAEEMFRILEEHQTDGWEDGGVVTAEIEESVEPLLSCVLNEDQTLTVMCAVLEPLGINDDNADE